MACAPRQLRLVTRADIRTFIEVSAPSAGSVWVDRFEAYFAKATTVRYANEDRCLGDGRLFGYWTT
jgi:hypothetical protein